MVRNLVEIVGFGRMRWVGKEPTFTFRAVAASQRRPTARTLSRGNRSVQPECGRRLPGPPRR